MGSSGPGNLPCRARPHHQAFDTHEPAVGATNRVGKLAMVSLLPRENLSDVPFVDPATVVYGKGFPHRSGLESDVEPRDITDGRSACRACGAAVWSVHGEDQPALAATGVGQG